MSYGDPAASQRTNGLQLSSDLFEVKPAGDQTVVVNSISGFSDDGMFVSRSPGENESVIASSTGDYSRHSSSGHSTHYAHMAGSGGNRGAGSGPFHHQGLYSNTDGFPTSGPANDHDNGLSRHLSQQLSGLKLENDRPSHSPLERSQTTHTTGVKVNNGVQSHLHVNAQPYVPTLAAISQANALTQAQNSQNSVQSRNSDGAFMTTNGGNGNTLNVSTPNSMASSNAGSMHFSMSNNNMALTNPSPSGVSTPVSYGVPSFQTAVSGPHSNNTNNNYVAAAPTTFVSGAQSNPMPNGHIMGAPGQYLGHYNNGDNQPHAHQQQQQQQIFNPAHVQMMGSTASTGTHALSPELAPALLAGQLNGAVMQGHMPTHMMQPGSAGNGAFGDQAVQGMPGQYMAPQPYMQQQQGGQGHAQTPTIATSMQRNACYPLNNSPSLRSTLSSASNSSSMSTPSTVMHLPHAHAHRTASLHSHGTGSNHSSPAEAAGLLPGQFQPQQQQQQPHQQQQQQPQLPQHQQQQQQPQPQQRDGRYVYDSAHAQNVPVDQAYPAGAYPSNQPVMNHGHLVQTPSGTMYASPVQSVQGVYVNQQGVYVNQQGMYIAPHYYSPSPSHGHMPSPPMTMGMMVQMGPNMHSYTYSPSNVSMRVGPYDNGYAYAQPGAGSPNVQVTNMPPMGAMPMAPMNMAPMHGIATMNGMFQQRQLSAGDVPSRDDTLPNYHHQHPNLSPYTHTACLNYAKYPSPTGMAPDNLHYTNLPPLFDCPVTVPMDLYSIIVPLRLLISLEAATVLEANNEAILNVLRVDYQAEMEFLPLNKGAVARVLVVKAKFGKLQYVLTSLILHLAKPLTSSAKARGIAQHTPYPISHSHTATLRPTNDSAPVLANTLGTRANDEVHQKMTTITILMSMTVVGAVIGPSGATINATRTATGCNIAISTSLLPNSTEKSVTVSGMPHKVYYSLMILLLNIVAAFAVKKGVQHAHNQTLVPTSDRKINIMYDLTESLRPATPYEPEAHLLPRHKEISVALSTGQASTTNTSNTSLPAAAAAYMPTFHATATTSASVTTPLTQTLENASTPVAAPLSPVTAALSAGVNPAAAVTRQTSKSDPTPPSSSSSMSPAGVAGTLAMTTRSAHGSSGADKEPQSPSDEPHSPDTRNSADATTTGSRVAV